MGSVGHLTNVEENEHHFTGFDLEILPFYFLAFVVSKSLNLVLLFSCFLSRIFPQRNRKEHV